MNPGDFVMPFGKDKGKTLDDIATTDAGLRYLDWAAGCMDGPTGDAIREYVDQDVIACDLDALVK